MTTAMLTKPVYRVPICERIRVAWSNWKVRKVGQAVQTLSKALQDDPGFRQSWHANIAMPIYDATHPKCYCIKEQVWNEHAPDCEVVRAHNSEEFGEFRHISAKQANYIADRLMKHLFGA